MMLRLLLSFTLFQTLASAVPTLHDPSGQAPLVQTAPDQSVSLTNRKLTGNFLHISDIHPDPFYVSGSDPDAACHRSSGAAGPIGAEKTACDTPISLVNTTFAWLAANLADEIDFVVWTGDSARHDNDERIPRNKTQVISQNSFLIEKFREVWGAEGRAGRNGEFKIPIVPTFGNNDILPHNIFAPGPNQWTKEYLGLWKRMIPEEQRHSFQRGGWYYVEVIPNKLAVFSLNTMYFFANNAAVDGCDDKSEPGYEHFEWLRIQLQLLRQRGVKAVLTGHVPPARNEEKEMWTESCWMKYALWVKQYRDVVVGSLWGHMNVEHFFLQDFNNIVWDAGTEALLNEDDRDIDAIETETPAEDDALNPEPPMELRRPADDPSFTIEVKPPSYLNALRQQWSSIPPSPPALTSPAKKKKPKKSPEDRYHEAIGGPHGERYAISFVSASIVPNFYPTIRVFKYNITGLEDAHVGTAQDMDRISSAHTNPFSDEADSKASRNDIEASVQVFETQHSTQDWNDIDASIQLTELAQSRTKKRKPHATKKEKKGKHGKKRRPRFAVPLPPSPAQTPGPAYAQQPLSWLGYVQYYANLTYIQRRSENETLHDELEESRREVGNNEGRLRDFKFEVEYNTTDSDDVYGLAPADDDEHSGITVRSVLDLASRIGSYKPSKQDLLEDSNPQEREFDEDTSTQSQHTDDSGDEADDSASDGESEDEDDDVAVEKKKKHKEHKKKKKRRKIINKTWFAFVDRALVGTVPPAELHRDYGQVDRE